MPSGVGGACRRPAPAASNRGTAVTTLRRIIVLGAAMLMGIGTLTGLTSAAAQGASPGAAPGDGPASAVEAARTAAPDAPVAARQARRRYWGAISIANRDYAWGTSYDFRTKRAARRAAKRKCRSASRFPRSCRVNMVLLNQCGAYAWKKRANGTIRWGWGRARWKGVAIRTAKRHAGGRGSRVLTWVCTTRP